MAARLGKHPPTFLLLHGLGLSHRSFTRAAKILTDHGNVIAIDLPGFGGTRRPTQLISVEAYADGVARVLERIQSGPVITVGHSMGAQIALELALVRPEVVPRVILIGPVTDPRRRTLWQQALGLFRDASLEPVRTNLMVLFEYARCGPTWFLTEARSMLAYPTHERIRQVTQPLLVLRGGNDPIADEHWATWLSTQPHNGSVHSTPRRRHNMVYSSPVDTAKQIVSFATATNATHGRDR